MDDLQIVYKSVDELIPYENNPRNNKQAVKYVANSIKEFGFKNPIIIDKDNVIVCGHTRLLGAKKLNIDKVPCIYANDLTDEQIKAFRLADNKVSEAAEWDTSVLSKELDGILNIDMSLFDFKSIFKEEITEEESEIEFTQSLGEEHNYIVLYFDNNVDWLQAQSLFNIKQVQEFSTRKDGMVKKPRLGIGRVLSGANAINDLLKDRN